MKASIYSLAWVAALIVAGCPFLWAQEPSPPAGHVLVLENERVLEGDIERQGDQYVIRRAGGEMRLPAAQALAVCASLQDAYLILAARTNLRDGDERLRLARWCHTHGLREQAIAEARASLLMRPGHAESKQLLTMLEKAAAVAAQPPTPTAEAGAAAMDPGPPLDVSADCLALFANKVQPILMNTCATCHASGRGGNFVLLRSTDTVGRRTMQLNLAAVVKLVSFDQPAASPLLYKACCAHGGALHAPLTDRKAAPFVALQSWVDLMTVQNPHLRPHGAPAVAAAPAARPVETAALPVARPVETVPSSANAGPARTVETQATTTPAAQEAHQQASWNAYDAEEFNRLAHPPKK